MAERLTRSRAQVGASPTVIDPTAELLRLFSEARQDAIAVLQGSDNGRRKLSEACAKVRQASTQLLEMVRDDLEYLEDPMGEGGGLAKPTTARLPQAQAGRAVLFLVDACHLTMRAVLHHCDLMKQAGLSPGPGSGADLLAITGFASHNDQHFPATVWCTIFTDMCAQYVCPQDAVVNVNGGGSGSSPDAAAAASASAAIAAAQLWRAAVNAAVALQDASRLLSVPRFYSAFTISDPTCGALLSVGELAADIMRRGAAASTAATAAVRAQQLSLTQQKQQLERKEEEEEENSGRGSRGGAKAAAAAALTAAAAAAAPDASCLLAAHGSSLLLVACEHQPESLLVIAAATLELAAARIMETGYCGGGGGGGGGGDAAIAAAAADNKGTAAATAASSGSSFMFSYHFRQMQLVAMRFSELLADDGGFKAMAKRALLPALAEALLAEPYRFVSCGAGLAAFGACFLEERFICAGEGAEREELYVGGRGRGYKRRKILNPDAHGVDTEQVGAVLNAMAAALECAVLLCKVLSNASVDPPPPPEGETEGERQEGGHPQLGGGGVGKSQRLPPGGGGGDDEGKEEEENDRMFGGKASSTAVDAMVSGGNGGGGSGGGAAQAMAAVALKREQGSELMAPPPSALPDAALGGAGVGSQAVPLAQAFRQLLEARYGTTECTTSAAAPLRKAEPVAAAEEGDGAGPGMPAVKALSAACGQIGHMARNLTTLLSLLLPVCPGGGDEVRDSVRQLGYPCLRWPRMNVRLPVLVVDQDCELLTGLLEDLTNITAEVGRRTEEECRQRDGDAKRDEKRRRRQEQEQKDAERRQKDKDRRQRDRDRVKAMKEAELAAAAGGGGEVDGGGEAYEYGVDGGGVGKTAATEVEVAAGGQAAPKVRLVLRRGGIGGGGGEPPMHGSPTAAAADVDAAGVAPQRKRARPSGDEEYDEEYDMREYGAPQSTRGDPVFAARFAATGRPPQMQLGTAGGMPYGANGLALEDLPVNEEDAAALLGLQVPRQRRSTRPVRPRTPTPPPDVLSERVRAAAAVAAAGPVAPSPPGRLPSASGGAPAAAAAIASGGPPGGGGRRHPASSLQLRQGAPTAAAAAAMFTGQGPARAAAAAAAAADSEAEYTMAAAESEAEYMRAYSQQHQFHRTQQQQQQQRPRQMQLQPVCTQLAVHTNDHRQQ
ncbi:hypothetical protein VOLCADRAFT_88966 [Volvox carteri f. nagariensis]|uniref:Uncharacterized protein n=1 Tax=Volvox carteri f. nagariensis TaxID=3068 RepID=D8TQF7_VOLCA|nr:uncharacterized protein VOLCADRAFT_88966 [Volvox carteri f. nagariensis]EFJ50397.1 hypothetical protein VOLCADRAFT_88966 [Volvox carteri f. nagariensis]|eukprot:XP_002948522.1 hypothetical protein VOLCADRAFT_88966 [Volvox carteri f. nagariensis]